MEQTIIDSILDYVGLGCELISIRGYGNLNDAIDYGRYVLPGVREALRQRQQIPKAYDDAGTGATREAPVVIRDSS